MPPSQFSGHEQCREAVCAACGVRTPKKRITPGEEEMVKEYAKPEYDSKIQNFPAGLCSTCRIHLNSCKRGVDWEKAGRPDPRLKWDKFKLKVGRYDEKKHNLEDCQICTVARWSPMGKKKNNTPKVLSKGESEPPTPKKKEEKKICFVCKQETGKGIPHKCTKNAAKRNLSDMISKESTSAPWVNI